MAVLQKIRNKPKLLIGIIAIALLAFIFPWNEFSSFINRQKNRAFAVNGDNISIQEYTTRVQNFEMFQKLISGQTSFDENTTLQIREFVYQEMIKEIMLDEQTLKLGIKVTNEEMNELLYGKNTSPVLQQISFFVNPQTKQVDPQAVVQFAQLANHNTKGLTLEEQEQVRSAKTIWETMLNLIKYTRLEEKYNILLASANILNNIEIEAAKEASTTSANIAYVIDRYSLMPDSAVTVSKSEIEKLYNERKNNFKTNDDLIKLSYFTKEITPSEDDYAVAFAQINEAVNKLKENENPALVVSDYSEVPFQDIYYSRNNLSKEEDEFAKTAAIGEIYGPLRDSKSYRAYKLLDRKQASDSLKLNMILIPGSLDTQVASNNKVDSIMNLINSGTEITAIGNSLKAQQMANYVSGWFTEAELTGLGKESLNKMFSTPVGEVSKANFQGNTAIFKIEDKTKAVDKYKFAYVQVPVGISEQTTLKIDNELNSFLAEHTDSKTFVKAAQDKGYNLIPNTLLSPETPSISQIPGSRDVIRWAFTNKNGSIKKFDLGNDRIVAVIESKVDKGYVPLSEVEDLLKSEIIKNKKAEKMISELKNKNLTSLQSYAEYLKTSVDTVKSVTFDTPNILGIGHESVLNAFAEIGKLNVVQEPVKGDNGVLIVEVLNRTDDNKDFNAKAYKEEMTRQNIYMVMSQAMQVLQEKMNVKDNRVNIGI